jgi:hypothetical protein
MKAEELKNAPKLFCESVNMAFTPEFFVMSLSSGSQATIYAFSPEHTKRLAQYLDHQVKEYEEKHGKIDAEWDPKIVSPVQRVNPPTELS